MSLVACGGSGGGSGGSGSEASSPGTIGTVVALPLGAAYKAFFVNGYSQAFDISGACTGTALLENSRAVAASFEGIAGYSSTSRSTFDAPNCGLVGATAATVQFVDENYRLLGYQSPSGGTGKYDAPVGLPAFVSVGDGATLGTQRLYLDSTRLIPTGKTVLSYAVDSSGNGANSVIVRLMTQTYNLADQLQATQTSAYRLGINASFVLMSTVTHFETGGSDLVLTPR